MPPYYEALEMHSDVAVGTPFAHPAVSDGAEDPEVNQIVAHSRVDRPANRISTAGIIDLVEEHAMRRNRLVKVTIETGSSDYNREALLSRYTNTGSSSSAQITVPAGSQAEKDLDDWADQYYQRYMDMAVEDRPPGNPPQPASARKKKAYLLNVAHIAWRYLNRYPGSNECKLLMHGYELSHHAEAYDMYPWEAFTGDENFAGSAYPFPHGVAVPGWRVEVSSLESYPLNDSRQNCARFGLMWRKPDGSLILDADYVGPTQCYHQSMSTPCYGPRPTEQSGWTTAGDAEVLAAFVPKRQKTRSSGRERPGPAPQAVE